MSSASSDPEDFRHRFTRIRRLPRASYEDALSFECMPLHVLLVTLCYDGAKLPILDPDRQFIARLADARSLDEVEGAIGEFQRHAANRRWLRRVGNFKLSTARLRRIAEVCLNRRAAAAEIGRRSE